jgi:hypothetical protein
MIFSSPVYDSDKVCDRVDAVKTRKSFVKRALVDNLNLFLRTKLMRVELEKGIFLKGF